MRNITACLLLVLTTCTAPAYAASKLTSTDYNGPKARPSNFSVSKGTSDARRNWNLRSYRADNGLMPDRYNSYSNYPGWGGPQHGYQD